MVDFPIFPAGTVLNCIQKFNKNKIKLTYQNIKVFYPCRLDAMAINPAGVVYNDTLKFTPGEVTISISIGIIVNIKILDKNKGELKISPTTKRKALVKHACYLMFKALGIQPSLYIDVDSSQVLKHCGFGSSTATISAVAVAINEMYNKPIPKDVLIQYLASNHGEEICDADEDNLKAVQSIGGSASGGMNKQGVLVIAGNAVVIASMHYEADVIIAIPSNFKEQNAQVLMELEEQNLWKFKRTGDKYKDKIAYHLLHIALPDMKNKTIKGLAEIVYDYRFNMGSINNCDFTYRGLGNLAKIVGKLYTEGHCDMLSLSSVGPAFFAITKNKKDKNYCINYFKENGFTIKEAKVFNKKYQVLEARTIYE